MHAVNKECKNNIICMVYLYITQYTNMTHVFEFISY